MKTCRVVFCNYFYTYIRLDVSGFELFNVFLPQLSSPVSFHCRSCCVRNNAGSLALSAGGGGGVPGFVLFRFFNPILSFLLLVRGTSGQGIKSY